LAKETTEPTVAQEVILVYNKVLKK
jgi:hypothetical protein